MWSAFWRAKSFPQKKKKEKHKQAWNSLHSLHLQYYWGVPLSTYLSIIYLYAPTFICDHLWESLLFMSIFLNIFLFMIICQNLVFLSLYENKEAYESYYLKQIFHHQNTIMIFFVGLICSHFMFLALNSSHFVFEYFFVR